MFNERLRQPWRMRSEEPGRAPAQRSGDGLRGNLDQNAASLQQRCASRLRQQRLPQPEQTQRAGKHLGLFIQASPQIAVQLLEQLLF